MGPAVIRKKSHVGGLTHFPGWPGVLMGRRRKENTARGLSLLDHFPSPGLGSQSPPPLAGWEGGVPPDLG